MIVRKLFVFDKNTWNHIILCKEILVIDKWKKAILLKGMEHWKYS